MYDAVPHLGTFIEIIGRDLLLKEYSLALTTAHAAAQMVVEQAESTGIRDTETALLVVRTLAEAAAATERATDASHAP
ncbi:hypothetical protein ACIPRD_32215 [Streptomyces sp. NPDC090108]|uniref:hypothetical protein n=1 Tax=Streptomyces sp. NPDC090108 TaxID=3365947 RepID=UPI003820AB6E